MIFCAVRFVPEASTSSALPVLVNAQPLKLYPVFVIPSGDAIGIASPIETLPLEIVPEAPFRL